MNKSGSINIDNSRVNDSLDIDNIDGTLTNKIDEN